MLKDCRYMYPTHTACGRFNADDVLCSGVWYAYTHECISQLLRLHTCSSYTVTLAEESIENNLLHREPNRNDR